MARTHYDTLGLKPTATDAEVKAAYRRVVLRHHPDRSADPDSTRLFIAATAAYEVVGEPAARRFYDEGLRAEARRAAEREAESRREQEAAARARAARAASTAPPPTRPTPPATPLPTQLARLSMLFSRGLYAEAEKLADEIVTRDPRQPLPYAVRGDLARGRGKLDEAARQYSLAVQMDPRNPLYLRRYEEVLERVRTVEATSKGGVATMEPNEKLTLAALATGLVAILAAVFVVLSPERPALFGFTVGMLSMLFLGGVVAGATLSAAGGLDRIDAYAAGRIGPTVALGLVSVVSFPAATALYVLLGLIQKGFSASTTRLFLSVTALVGILGLGAALSRSGMSPVGVLLWGGNLAYLGALVGWTVADGLRR